MGAYSNAIAANIEEETRNGQTVAATLGYFVLDERRCDDDPEPVLAWRIGNDLVLPISRMGLHGECYVVHPDGRVRHHGVPGCGDTPDFETAAAWRESVKAGAAMWRSGLG